jgi:hypothetical protein
MLDAAVLARALRAGIRLRDKMVVLRLDPASLGDPERLEALAGDLALGRALGMRIVAVCDPGSGPGALDAQGPALRLVAALEKHGERGVPLSAASVVTVHRLPAAAVAASGGSVPGMIPVVNTIVLIHLSSLGYVPILLLPAADTAGEVAELAADAIAAAVAQFTGAALLVSLGDHPTATLTDPSAQAGAPNPPGPPTLVTSSATPGRLLLDILLNAPHPAPAQPVSPNLIAAR